MALERARLGGVRQHGATSVNRGAPFAVFQMPVTAGADVNPPTFAGGAALTISNKTHNAYRVAWPAASDDVGVAGYRISLNGGSSWETLGDVLLKDVTGRAPGTTDNVEVQASDAAGNWSASLSAAVTLLSIKIAPTLKDPSTDSPRASQTAIALLVLGEQPGSTATPTVLAATTTATTDGSGVLDVPLNSSGKSPGDVVWLVLIKSDGNPAHAGYGVCWPASVVAA